MKRTVTRYVTQETIDRMVNGWCYTARYDTNEIHAVTVGYGDDGLPEPAKVEHDPNVPHVRRGSGCDTSAPQTRERRYSGYITERRSDMLKRGENVNILAFVDMDKTDNFIVPVTLVVHEPIPDPTLVEQIARLEAACHHATPILNCCATAFGGQHCACCVDAHEHEKVMSRSAYYREASVWHTRPCLDPVHALAAIARERAKGKV